MNFYYDPILGLQFTSGFTFFIIDVDSIPQILSVDEILNSLWKTGVNFVNSKKETEDLVTVVANITNHKL